MVEFIKSSNYICKQNQFKYSFVDTYFKNVNFQNPAFIKSNKFPILNLKLKEEQIVKYNTNKKKNFWNYNSKNNLFFPLN